MTYEKTEQKKKAQMNLEKLQIFVDILCIGSLAPPLTARKRTVVG